MIYDIDELSDTGHRMAACWNKSRNFMSTFAGDYLEAVNLLKSGRYGEDWNADKWLLLRIGCGQDIVMQMLTAFRRTLSAEQRAIIERDKKSAALGKKEEKLTEREARIADREAKILKRVEDCDEVDRELDKREEENRVRKEALLTERREIDAISRRIKSLTKGSKSPLKDALKKMEVLSNGHAKDEAFPQK